jgi:hypothetical protein
MRIKLTSARTPVTARLAVGEARNGTIPSRFMRRMNRNIVHNSGRNRL